MFKATGSPIDVFREHMLVNSGSFSTTNQDSDDYRQAAINAPTPTRNTLVPDTTAWSINPPEDSWNVRLHGAASGANKAATQRGGNLT
jgi:hypothetical protein